MYALIDLTKVKSVRSWKYYETIPDGRAIVPFSDLRAFGTLENVDLVATATELKQFIEKQKEQGLISGIPLEDTATQNGEKNPENSQTDGTTSGEGNTELGETEGSTESGGMQEILPPLEEGSKEEEIMPIDEGQKSKKGGKQ